VKDILEKTFKGEDLKPADIIVKEGKLAPQVTRFFLGPEGHPIRHIQTGRHHMTERKAGAASKSLLWGLGFWGTLSADCLLPSRPSRYLPSMAYSSCLHQP